jgi:dsRNA-specific ribonuclease
MYSIVCSDRRQQIKKLLAAPFWNIAVVYEGTFSLCDTTLTHSSYENEQSYEDYERLEFLGDRILNCAVAEFRIAA